MNLILQAIKSLFRKVDKTLDSIPEWAKQLEKPTYTADEVGAQPKDFIITFSGQDKSNLTADTTWAEATEAYKSGARLVGYYNGRQYALTNFYEDEEAHFRYDSIPELKERRIYFLYNSKAYMGESRASSHTFPVQSVNGKTGAVQLTASDVGALSETELQTAVNTALTQAKASGDFQGEPGDDYVLTDSDKQEIAELAADLVDIPENDGTITDEQITRAVSDYMAENPISGIAVTATGATVGQTVKISSVDENGVPTAWEVTDFPSGGSQEWKLLIDTTIAEEDAAVTLYLDKDSDGNPFSCTEISIRWIGIVVTDGTASGKAWISFNPSKVGYNAGKNGFTTNDYFYYTTLENYSRGCVIELKPNMLSIAEQTKYQAVVTNETDIHSLEISGYQRKAFYGRVIVYGR